MATPSKRSKKTRVKSDFDVERLKAEQTPRNLPSAAFSWTLDQIANARDQQMCGRFNLAARLAQSVKIDGAIFSAIENRLAPQRGLPVEVAAANDTAKAKSIANEAEALYGRSGVALSPETLIDMNEQLAMHGVAFATNRLFMRADGSRVDTQVRAWPISTVSWDAIRCTFYTYTAENDRVDIVHGDGRWIVARKSELEPWQSGAIKALALIWAARANGVRDRAKASRMHGNGKLIGSLPEGVALQQGGSNTLSAEAQSLINLLSDLYSSDKPVGVKPAGSTIDLITSNSQAWQIFQNIVDSNTADAARVMLGSDGLIKATGGNYIKDGILFGVRNDIVEGDLSALERAIATGSIEPWTAINFGTSDNAPCRRWLMPDPDEDARRDSLAKRTGDFNDAIAAYSKNFEVDQDFVDELAKSFGIRAPKLKPPAPPPVAMPPTADPTNPDSEDQTPAATLRLAVG